jgi:hypothetical protein
MLRSNKIFFCGFLILILPFLFNYKLFAQNPVKVVSISSYGIYPGEGKNTLPAIRAALKANKGVAQLVLSFPEGRYDFYPDATTKSIQGFELLDLKNVTIDGNGSSFIFHSEMAPIYIGNCENVTLKNFSIDWDRPYISQGQIVQALDEYVDIRIDKQAYPFVIENGRIMFKGENWLLGVTLHNLYDKDRKEIVYKTLDNPMGTDFFKSRAEEISDGLVRFYAHPSYKPVPGTYVSMLHARYLPPCIQLIKSKKLTLRHINIFHSLGMGVVAFRSENIELDTVNVTVNEKKGRVFSAIADAFHFSTCKGLIKITGCTNTGQGDDFVNIHGEYTPVKEFTDAYTVITEKAGKVRDVKELLYKGDGIWLADSATAQRTGPYLIESIEPQYRDSKVSSYRLRLNKKLPEGISGRYYIENETWNPQVEISNCKFLKKNRARGILVTTPGKVLIENNYFNTAGAAILIEGDVNFWFESGAVNHVTIRNNIFENCASSGQYWGEAVITISPSYKPADNQSKAYHTGIKIENNEFRHFDYAILFARSVQDLQFLNNKLVRTNDYVPFSTPVGFMFDGCRKVKLLGNSITGDFLGTGIKLRHMNANDVYLNSTGLKMLAQ